MICKSFLFLPVFLLLFFTLRIQAQSSLIIRKPAEPLKKDSSLSARPTPCFPKVPKICARCTLPNGAFDSTCQATGKWVINYTIGTKESQGTFTRGKKTGPWQYWYETGMKAALEIYDSSATLTYSLLFDLRGRKHYEKTYNKKGLNGSSKTYDINGYLSYEQTYTDGKMTGWINWSWGKKEGSSRIYLSDSTYREDTYRQDSLLKSEVFRK